jgi:hypothetical protein
MPQLKLARVLEHQDIVMKARQEAIAMLDDDPDLRSYDHIALAREMHDRFSEVALDVVHSG